MSTIGCLITDPPTFQDPKATLPFLVLPKPNPGQVVVVDTELLQSTGAVTFEATVVSQDDTTQPDVSSRLFIDYGFYGPDLGQPYRYVRDGQTFPGPGTIDDTTSRKLSVSWYPSLLQVEPGCHTATLMVSHGFDDEGCPKCDSDYTSITWTILRCDSAMSNCDQLPVDGCKLLTNNCETAHKATGVKSVCSTDADAGADGGT